MCANILTLSHISQSLKQALDFNIFFLQSCAKIKCYNINVDNYEDHGCPEKPLDPYGQP